MAGEDTSHPHKWFKDGHSLVKILLVLLALLSLPYFSAFSGSILPHIHPALSALLSGVIVNQAVYPSMRGAGLTYAVLLGLLVAEFVAYRCGVRGVV